MGKNTEIPWCHHTFSPWGGCTRVSAGCGDATGGGCYAETLAKRFQKIHGTWGMNGRRVVASENMWRQPLKWNRAAEKEGVRKRVFCASMADVFEDRTDLVMVRNRLFTLIGSTPMLDWLLLTKRPENVAGWEHWHRNAWLGVSVENQEMAEKRIPILLDLKRRYDIPVAFLSVEPMLGAVDIFLKGTVDIHGHFGAFDWVICGGESGANARPMEMSWALDLRRQCAKAGIPFFMKQGSAANWPDFKNFSSFPPGLQVREFPR